MRIDRSLLLLYRGKSIRSFISEVVLSIHSVEAAVRYQFSM